MKIYLVLTRTPRQLESLDNMPAQLGRSKVWIRIYYTLSTEYFEPKVAFRFRIQEVLFIIFSDISEGIECKLR